MSKPKVIIRGSGTNNRSVLINQIEESVMTIDMYMAVFMPDGDRSNGERIVATEETKEEFHIILNKKRVTTILLKRSDNANSENSKKYMGDDFSGVAVVLFRCKNAIEGFQYHIAYIQGKHGSYYNMLFDTYGMEVDLISIFKKLIKPEDNIEFLPAYDRFIEKADVTVPGDAGGERDEQETQEIY